jgi:ferredoxin
MPTITVLDGPTFEAEPNQRLILALEDHQVDILHRCGGFARCTTCRVEVHSGEPERMTQAELDRLQQSAGFLGTVRLSCQILCDHDMTVRPLMSKANMYLEDAGPRPEHTITPTPEWIANPVKK